LTTYNEKKTVELGVDEDEKKKKKNKKLASTTLTSDQKFDIANKIHEDLLGEIDSSKKSSERMIASLRAVLEETDIKTHDLKRDYFEFIRDIVKGAENKRTGKIVAEKVIRYYEDKTKQTDAIIEKLRLKNATLKNQISKIETTLAQKEDGGDVLHYIDFHQLQIENKQYIAKIEERNDELLSVKHSTSKTIQILNEYKRRLNKAVEDSNWLNSEMTAKKTQQSKLDAENKRVNKEVVSEHRTKTKLRMQIEESQEMPEIADYILQKKEMYSLESMLKNWQKKVDIMEMAAKRSRSTLQKTKF
jgi:hypothetical protein